MESTLPPLLFHPVYKDYLWGGQRICERFHRKNVPPRCAESWEITDRDDGMSVVEGGVFANRTLFELVHVLGEDLLGKGKNYVSFPLLVKLIDAKKRLSVQVHPDEINAVLTGGEPKTEMWYLLNDPNYVSNAAVFAGFKRACTREQFLKLTESGSAEDYESLFSRFSAQPGDAFLIPAGRVHAIDQGCLLFEVQQNSNTTYRLWDWDRTGPDGKKRELHIQKALDVVKWGDAECSRLAPKKIVEKNGLKGDEIVANQYFSVRRYSLDRVTVLDTERLHFDILFAPDTNMVIENDRVIFRVPEGRTCLVPAAMGEYRLTPEKIGSELLRVFVP